MFPQYLICNIRPQYSRGGLTQEKYIEGLERQLNYLKRKYLPAASKERLIHDELKLELIAEKAKGEDYAREKEELLEQIERYRKYLGGSQ